MPAPGPVGIVVVSHSRALAEAAVDLATRMVTGNRARVAVAAGTPDGGLGTDATAVAGAIRQVDAGAGVLVLVDLGSAVLSAELAVELLEDTIPVTVSAAGLVEGLVAAVVKASGGADLQAVAAEADRALAVKYQLVSGPPPVTVPDQVTAEPPADVDPPTDRGEDSPAPQTGATTPAVTVEEATGADDTPKVRLVLDPDPDDRHAAARSAGSVREELAALQAAVTTARVGLTRLVAQVCAELDVHAAQLIAVQLAFLHHHAVLPAVTARIFAGQSAVHAWRVELEAARRRFEVLTNPYLRARGQDVTSLERRVRAALLGVELMDVTGLSGVVAVDELDAPTAAALDPSQIRLVVVGDPAEGHGVLLARRRGLRLHLGS